MHGNRSNRIIDFKASVNEFDAQTNQHSSDNTDDGGANCAYKSARRRNSDQARQQTVAGHRGIRFSIPDPHVENRSERPSATGKHRVYGNRTDAQCSVTGSGKRAARIEAEPAKGENETPRQHENDVMPRYRVWPTITVVFADTWSDNHRYRQSGETTDCVHDTRPRKITVTLTQAEVRAQLRQPAAAPCPIGEDWIGDRTHEDG